MTSGKNFLPAMLLALVATLGVGCGGDAVVERGGDDAGLGPECGAVTCNEGQVCCNASCGTCTAPGEACSTIACTN